MSADQLEIFNTCRPVLLGLARRILGNESEAEDMVQETYLRWQRTDWRQVKSPKAFLTTTLTRLCLNQLQLGPGGEP
jgi:RNA polymerase sigma-70 factor, ECF subfamily